MSWLCSTSPNNFHFHPVKAKPVSHPFLPLWFTAYSYLFCCRHTGIPSTPWSIGHASDLELSRLLRHMACPSFCWGHFSNFTWGKAFPDHHIWHCNPLLTFPLFPEYTALPSLLHFLSLSPSNLLCTLLIYSSFSLHWTIGSGRAEFSVLSIAVSQVLRTVSNT